MPVTDGEKMNMIGGHPNWENLNQQLNTAVIIRLSTSTVTNILQFIHILWNIAQKIEERKETYNMCYLILFFTFQREKELANDGRWSNHTNFAHTREDDLSPWITIDLLYHYRVSKVLYMPRQNSNVAYYRANNIEVSSLLIILRESPE